jgi:hypothetical protein
MGCCGIRPPNTTHSHLQAVPLSVDLIETGMLEYLCIVYGRIDAPRAT